MVNQWPAQLSGQTCGHFAAPTAILAGNRDSTHDSNSLLIHTHGFASLGFNTRLWTCGGPPCSQPPYGFMVVISERCDQTSSSPASPCSRRSALRRIGLRLGGLRLLLTWNLFLSGCCFLSPTHVVALKMS